MTPLAREIARRLSPIIAPAREKADMLIEELAARHDELAAFTPKGLADAVRRLQSQLQDTHILAAADALMDRMKRDYGTRENVS